MNFPNFIGGSYESAAVTADQERTVNFYTERMESPGATTRVALYPTPGAELITQTNSTAGRAHIFIGDREFAVIGANVIEIDGDGVVTLIGTVAVDSNPATLSSNGDGGGQIFVTSGGNGYYFSTAPGYTLTQITALNGKATMGAALDGYFLALDANTGTLYSSALLAGATWTTGVMFAQRIAAADPWIAMYVLGPYIWLLGPQTSEVWYDAGASPFPFAKHPSGLIQYGIAAAFSGAVCDTSLLWLGSTKSGQGFVLRATGFSPEVVSSYAVQHLVGEYTTVSDAYGDSYTEAGHTFYVLNFPSANKTWVYDVQMGMWAERGTWDANISDWAVWGPRCHALAFGEHRWLHGTGTGIYRTSLSVGTDVDGTVLRRMRRAPALMSENERIFLGAFELDVEPGLGLVSGQGVDPQVMLRISRDGGKTWGPERMRSAGKMGEYGRRIRWERCGAARRAVFEVVVSDPIPWRLTGAYLSTPQAAQERRTA